MELLIGLLINLLILALIVVVVFWVLGILASAFELPPKIVVIVKAIIVLIILLWVIQVFLGNTTGFYPVPRH